MGYDVLTRPWIPVWTGQELRKVGLMEALTQAQRFACVQADTPLVTCAILRLLIAFAMDACRLSDTQARRALYRQGRFERAALETYVAECRREGECFDLFDRARPFMQAAYDERYDAGKEKSVGLLVHELPTGNNHVHFDHRYEDECRLPVDEAVGRLLATYLFCTAGLSGPSSVNNTPCVYALCQEEDLFHTIVMNMLSVSECGDVGLGTPAWRDRRPVVPKQAVNEMSMLEGLTWRPRRALLVEPEAGRPVTRAYVQPGLDFRGSESWRDPHVFYRRNDKGELFPVRPRTGRALWRDVGTIVMTKTGKENEKYGIAPFVVRQRGQIRPQEDDESMVAVTLAGLVTSQATYLDAYSDTLNLPRDVLEDYELATCLNDDVGMMEYGASLVGFVIRQLTDLADASGDDGTERKRAKGSAERKTAWLEALVQEAQGAYFDKAHAWLFTEYLPSLRPFADDEAFEKHCIRTDDQIWAMIHDTFEGVLDRAGYSGRALMAQANARNLLFHSYQKKRKEREDGFTCGKAGGAPKP